MFNRLVFVDINKTTFYDARLVEYVVTAILLVFLRVLGQLRHLNRTAIAPRLFLKICDGRRIGGNSFKLRVLYRRPLLIQGIDLVIWPLKRFCESV